MRLFCEDIVVAYGDISSPRTRISWYSEIIYPCESLSMGISKECHCCRHYHHMEAGTSEEPLTVKNTDQIVLYPIRACVLLPLPQPSAIGLDSMSSFLAARQC